MQENTVEDGKIFRLNCKRSDIGKLDRRERVIIGHDIVEVVGRIRLKWREGVIESCAYAHSNTRIDTVHGLGIIGIEAEFDLPRVRRRQARRDISIHDGLEHHVDDAISTEVHAVEVNPTVPGFE